MPSVSVLVPAHNEERTLPVLLHCLSVQTYPQKNLEIILVDDRSTDKTYDTMRHFSKRHPRFKPYRITGPSDTRSPKKIAIEEAVRQSCGEILLTTDADTRPGPNWIKAIVETYDAETGAVLGYAPYRTDGPYRTVFHQLLALEYFSLAAVALATAQTGHPSTCNGANFSYRKIAFETVGGFGETLNHLSGDDDLFLHRLRARTTWQIRYASDPDACVFNDPPNDFRAFFWQRIRFASKHLAYPVRMRWVLSGVYLYYCTVFFWLVASLFSIRWWVGFGLLLAAKTFVELLFLFRAQRILEKRNLLQWYPLIVIPHLVYVVCIPILARMIKPRWK